MRSAFLADAAAQILKKASVQGEQALNAHERTFLRVWEAEANFAAGRIRGVPAASAQQETVAAYLAIGAPETAELLDLASRLSSEERSDDDLGAGINASNEDADRLLARFWKKHSPSVHADMARIAGLFFPQFVVRLALWTAIGCMIPFLMDQASSFDLSALAGLPIAGVAFVWVGLRTLVAAFRQLRYPRFVRTILVFGMLAGSIGAQILAFRVIGDPPTDAALEKVFRERRDRFEELLTLAWRDGEYKGGKKSDGSFDMFIVSADGSSRGWSQTPLSDDKVGVYQRLLGELDLSRVRRWWTSEPIYFYAWSRGNYEHSRSKGYVYSETRPDGLVDDLDDYARGRRGDFEAWKPLGDHWYIFVRRY